jgi:hypothetical protein
MRSAHSADGQAECAGTNCAPGSNDTESTIGEHVVEFSMPAPSEALLLRGSVSLLEAEDEWEETANPTGKASSGPGKSSSVEDTDNAAVSDASGPIETDQTVADAKIASFVSKISWALWLGDMAVLVQVRGSWLRTLGFGWRKHDYLYPEEALLLLEGGKLLLYENPVDAASGRQADAGDADSPPAVLPDARLLTAAELRAAVVPRLLPLPVLLAYNRLKVPE